VEEAVEVGEDTAPRAGGGGESDHVMFDGVRRAAAPPYGRRERKRGLVFLSRFYCCGGGRATGLPLTC
jgi:hypothetical protein